VAEQLKAGYSSSRAGEAGLKIISQAFATELDCSAALQNISRPRFPSAQNQFSFVFNLLNTAALRAEIPLTIRNATVSCKETTGLRIDSGTSATVDLPCFVVFAR
jgi:hypothetical protein